MAKDKPLNWMVPDDSLATHMSHLTVPDDPGVKFDPTDLTWPGAYSELSEEKTRRYEKWAADPGRLLRKILAALILGHSDQHVERRLEEAFCAITNTPAPRGNRVKADDETILLEMGEMFFLRSFGFEEGSLIVGEIAMDAIRNVRGDKPTIHSEDSFKRRLRKKFTADLDRWCFVAAERHGFPWHGRLRDVLIALERLGVPVRTDDHKSGN